MARPFFYVHLFRVATQPLVLDAQIAIGGLACWRKILTWTSENKTYGAPLGSIVRPIALMQPDLEQASPWLGHVPFAFWLVDALRPRTIVELGTHTGVSYCAFCQAVTELRIPTLCWAVDTWKGDEHAGLYGEEVFETLKAHHDSRYGAFSRLVRTTFNDAVLHFADSSIDLLHIDGLHTEEAVSGDFANWRSKLSSRAVVLFHDVNVRERDFGVWKFWATLRETYPSFTFAHSHGLGVLAFGPDTRELLEPLTSSAAGNGSASPDIRTFFERLGDRLTMRSDREFLLRENSRLNSTIVEFQSDIAEPASNFLHSLEEPASDKLLEPGIDVTRAMSSQERQDNEGQASNDGLVIGRAELAIEHDYQVKVYKLEASLARARMETVMLSEEVMQKRKAALAVDISKEEMLAAREAIVAQREMEATQAHLIAGQVVISNVAEMQAELARTVGMVYSSTSWRVTAPMRAATRLLRAAQRGDLQALQNWRQTMHAPLQSVQPQTKTSAESPQLPVQARLDAAPVPQPSPSVGEPALPAQPDIVQLVPKRPLIVFVSGFPGSPSETFRVHNPISVLQEFFEILALRESDLAQHRTIIETSAAVLVLFRIGLDETIFEIIPQARRNGCVIVYDVDDLVFDPAIATARFIDGLRALTPDQLPSYRRGIEHAARLVDVADVCMVPTGYLVERVARRGRTALLLPNGISVAMLNWFNRAEEQSTPATDGKLRIGYASGSHTHQRDFATVGPALLKLLSSRDDVLLTIIGAFDLEEYPEFAEVAGKIERRPLVSHADLPSELARFDINIAPLELGNPYCEAKSELKYFDAAVLKVPTVATPIAGYLGAIMQGVTGFLAATEVEWRETLEMLLDDKALRIRVGLQARNSALRKFGPGNMRMNTMRTFQALLKRRREVTRYRHLGYDNFLYAINYPPAVKISAATRRPAAGKPLELHWILPPFTAGAGGVSNILRMIRHLEVSGHRSSIWLHTPWETTDEWKQGVSERYHRLINEEFMPIRANVQALPTDLETIVGDAVIATDHYSAYPARALPNVRRRFYFLQDHESEFSPSGFASLFAGATLNFGFDAISNGTWLHELAMREGMWSVLWEQAADPAYYFLGEQRRVNNRIAFYSRLETPRRAVELGLLAFELLVRWGVDFHVDFFGGDVRADALPYSCTSHGVLSADRLGRLYRSATIGMVFSATNYSIIPREMMACGLPVVEIDLPSTRMSFSESAAVLSDTTPEAVARNLRTLLLDRTRRDQMALRGTKHAAQFTWAKSAQTVEHGLLQRLNADSDQLDASAPGMALGVQHHPL